MVFPTAVQDETLAPQCGVGMWGTCAWDSPELRYQCYCVFCFVFFGVFFPPSLCTPGRPPSSTAHWSVVQSKLAAAWQLRAGREQRARQQRLLQKFSESKSSSGKAVFRGTVVQRLCPQQPQPERVCFLRLIYLWVLLPSEFYAWFKSSKREALTFKLLLLSNFRPQMLDKLQITEEIIARKMQISKNHDSSDELQMILSKQTHLTLLQYDFINQASKLSTTVNYLCPRV